MKSFGKSAITSALLSALFLSVYGSCNVITGLRPHVGSWHFAWERRIPFLPALILPYMSIDLFFIAAPFLARSDRERRTLSRRITAAILIAGVCFLFFPLKFAFPRPHVAGFLGLIFNNFRDLDAPFNEFPSLHVALWAILADIYFRHSKGHLRLLLASWFALILLSTVLTYQHHVVDVFGGFALAILCLHFFRDEPLRQPFIANRRVGSYYLVGAALLTAFAFAFTPWTCALLWPAASLALAAAAYFLIGPGLYRKQNGRIAATTVLLFWPILLGQFLSRLYYARHCRPYDRLDAHLLIGRRLSAAEARAAVATGITAVVDLTAESSESLAFRALPYLQVPILDLSAPTAAQIDSAVDFIRRHADRGKVYLHCKIGYSRTAVIAGAHLLATRQAQSLDHAITQLRHARPTIIIRLEAMQALHDFAARLPGAAADAAPATPPVAV